MSMQITKNKIQDLAKAIEQALLEASQAECVFAPDSGAKYHLIITLLETSRVGQITPPTLSTTTMPVMVCLFEPYYRTQIFDLLSDHATGPTPNQLAAIWDLPIQDAKQISTLLQSIARSGEYRLEGS